MTQKYTLEEARWHRSFRTDASYLLAFCTEHSSATLAACTSHAYKLGLDPLIAARELSRIRNHDFAETEQFVYGFYAKGERHPPGFMADKIAVLSTSLTVRRASDVEPEHIEWL